MEDKPGIFDEPYKDESGVWKSTTLGRLREEARAAFLQNNASFLAAMGYLKLLHMIGDLYRPGYAGDYVNMDGTLGELLLELQTNFKPPAGTVLDTESVNDVVMDDIPNPFGEGTAHRVNLVALAKFVEGACDRLDERITEGKTTLISTANITIRAK